MLLSRRTFVSLFVVAAAVAACSAGDDDASTDTSAVTTTTAVPSNTTPSTTAVNPRREYDFSAIGPIVEAGIERFGLNGAGLVIVERDDGIVHEQYWGDFDADRISLVASASKMVSAGVLMYLDDQGLIDVDAPVADVVDWGQDNPTITPAQLVSNSSGFRGLADDTFFGPYLCQFFAEGSLADCAEQIFTTSADDEFVAAPDTEFRYGGVQWQIAGAVAEAASGMSWAELIDEIYVEPCELTTLGFNSHFTQFPMTGIGYPIGFDGDASALAPTDNPNIEAGMYTAPPDYALLLLMHLRGGMCGDERVLSPEAVDRLHADRVAEVYDGSAGPDTGYGMGWWIDRSSGIISDGGLYGAYPWLDVDGGFGAYLVVEDTNVSGEAIGTGLIEPITAAIDEARGTG